MGNSKSKADEVISEMREEFLKKLDESIKSNNDYFFVNPSVLWENLHPSNRFSIQTFPRDHLYLSEITFNHQKFQDVHPKLKDSRDRVAIKAMRVLLGFDHTSWSDFFLPEDEREEKRNNKIIKEYKRLALERKSQFKTPLDLWTCTTNNSITTDITESGTYCSKIIFLNKTLVVIDYDENASRQKVAEKALTFFFDISLPFKHQTTLVIQKTNLDTEIKNSENERVTKSELCKSQTPQLIQKIKSDTVKTNPENDRLKVIESCKIRVEEILNRSFKNPSQLTPVSIWDSITAGKYPIDTYVISMTREYRSDINFCGILTQAYDLDYQKSRHKVAVFALEKFFKVSFPQWNIYKKLPPIDKKKEEKEQLEKQQKEREETISMYKASLQEILRQTNRNSCNTNPVAIWYEVTGIEFPIKTTSISTNFLSQIEFYDQIFKAEDPEKQKSRHKVATIAIEKLLGVSVPRWKIYKENTPTINERDSKQVVTTNVIDEKQKDVEFLQNCVEDILKKTRDPSNLTPLAVWNKTTELLFPVKTVDTPSGKYLSKITFYKQLVTAEDADEQKSRHKVAALAFEKFLNVSHPSWNIYKDPKPGPTNSNALQQPKKEELLSPKIVEIEICRKNAEDILRRIDDNNSNLTPLSIWNISTGQKYKVDTVQTPAGTNLSKIKFFDVVFTAEDADVQKSRHKVAALALEKLFNISHPKWNIYKDPKPGLTNLNALQQPKKQELHSLKIDEIDICHKNAEDILRRFKDNEGNLTPLNIWNISTKQKYKVATTKTPGGTNLSKIEFFDVVFTAEDANERKSRHKVAALAFEKLLNISHPKWNIYKDQIPGPKNTFQKPENPKLQEQELNQTPKNPLLEIELKNEFSKRAKDILNDSNSKIDKTYPINLWNEATLQKFPITTTTTKKGHFSSKVEFFNTSLIQVDEIKENSQRKLAAVAFKEFLGIVLPQPKCEDVKPKDVSANVGSNVKCDNHEKINAIQMYRDHANKLLSRIEKFIESTPTNFWYCITKNQHQIISCKDSNNQWIARITFFDETLEQKSTSKINSRHDVSEMACNKILGIALPHWKSYKGQIFQKLPAVNSEVTIKEKTIQKQQVPVKMEEIEDTDSCDVDEGLLNELLKNPLPEKVKFSNEQIEEILEKLSNSAREILIENEGITPDEFWNLVTNNYPEYKIVTEFNSKSEKYESTIEFHDKTFTKADVDQHKSESMVACQALDELLGIEFNEGDDDSLSEDIVIGMSNDESLKQIQVNDNEFPSSSYYVRSDFMKEPLSIRIEMLLNLYKSENLKRTFEDFIKSAMPSILKEDERSLLNKINGNIFKNPKRGSEFSSYVFVNDYQIFGSGKSQEEARFAVIISAFKHIEAIKEGKTLTIEHETKNKSWIDNLKDLQKSLRDEKKCLDDIPCTEIFSKIGLNFDLGYSEANEEFDPTLTNIKELTSRFLLKKLLDAAYEVED